MKKIVFRKVYECKECKRKIVGYVGRCPICKGEVTQVDDEKIVTLVKTTRWYNK